MDFIWGVLAIAAAIGVYLAYRKGVSQGFKFSKKEHDRLIEPKLKIERKNGEIDAMTAILADIKDFKRRLKLKRSGKMIDKMADEKLEDLEKIKEMVRKEIEETRRRAGSEYMDRMARSGLGRSGYIDAGLQQILSSLGLSPEYQERIRREGHKPGDVPGLDEGRASGLIQSLLNSFLGKR